MAKRQSAAKSTAASLKARVSVLTNGLGTAGAWLQAAVTAWAPIVVGWAGSVWQTISSTFQSIYSSVAPVVASIVNWISSNFLQIVTIATGYWMAVYDLVSTVVGGVWAVVKTIGSALSSTWTSAMSAIGISTTTTGTKTGDAFAAIQGACLYLQKTITLAFNVATFAIQNLGTIAAYVLVTAAAKVVEFGNQVAYVFTTVVPGHLIWFGKNFTTILKDTASFLGNVFKNMLANAFNFGKALWGAIQGKGFDFEFKGLTDGFKASLTELPQIADRQIGAFEKSLKDQSATLGNSLATGLADHLAQADDRAKSAAKAMVDGLQNAVNNRPDIKPPEIKTPILPDLTIDTNTQATDAMRKGLDGVQKSAQAAADALNLVTAGTAEAMAARASAAADVMLAEARKNGDGSVGSTPAAVPTGPAVAATKPPDVRRSADSDNKLMSQVALLIAQINAGVAKVVKNTADAPAAATI